MCPAFTLIRASTETDLLGSQCGRADIVITRKTRVFSSTVAIAIGVLAAALSGQQHAPAAEVAGQQLTLRAKATRSTLFGTVDLYSVGIYAGAQVSSSKRLRDSSLTKAVRVAVLYEGGMPAKVPSDWWQELVPALSPAH